MFFKSTVLAASLFTVSNICAEDQDIDLHPHKMNFSFTQFGYEYIKKDDLYCGADFKITPIWNLKNKTVDKHEYWSNIETRLGYNFGISEKHSLIPYGAFGYSHFNLVKQNWDLKQLACFTLGIKSLHTFGPVFEMGLHLRSHRNILINYSIDGYKVAADNSDWKIEIALPCIWHMGDTKQWEIQFEPYYLQLPTSNNGEFLGSRLTFGYRF